jgi:hypothetical protein
MNGTLISIFKPAAAILRHERFKFGFGLPLFVVAAKPDVISGRPRSNHSR